MFNVQTGDKIQLEVIGELQGQEVRNVFHYDIATNTAGLVDIEEVIPLWFIGFDTNVIFLLTEDMVYRTVKGVNLSNPFQIYEESVTANGDQTGDTMPVHDTISVKLIRSTALTRNGRKAYSGIPESVNVNGSLTYIEADVENLEQWHHLDKIFNLPSDPSIEILFQPVIIGRTLNGQSVYELDLSKINPISGAQMQTRVRTQNTRKF